MSKNGEKAKKNYEAGFWNKTALRNLVKKGWLTSSEYRDITGEDCGSAGNIE